jgi:hypothetical protein
VFSTRYHRWNATQGERENLLAKLADQDASQLIDQLDKTVPKLGSPIGLSVMEKLLKNRALSQGLFKLSDLPIFRVQVPGYFCQFYLRQPKAGPERGRRARPRGELLVVYTTSKSAQRVLHAVLNSSTFYRNFCVTTHGTHNNPPDVKLFPFDSASSAGLRASLERASREIEASFAKHTTRVRKSGLLIDSVQVEKTNTGLDAADRALAPHYAFDEEDIDAIVNYDVKYRLGENVEDCE